MSETKLQFLNRMMNDTNMRQRNRNAQDRRRAAEALWDEKHGDDPEPEPEPEPLFVTKAATPDPAEDDEAQADGESDEDPDLDDAPAA
jgi:hypothetical protein